MNRLKHKFVIKKSNNTISLLNTCEIHCEYCQINMKTIHENINYKCFSKIINDKDYMDIESVLEMINKYFPCITNEELIIKQLLE